jgi:death-on-curing protein
MSQTPVFLTCEHVLAIHRRMIDEFGGAPEVRDPGLLESAVSMPQAKFDGRYLHASLPVMAAAYLFHLCKNHPFLDGSKRTALAAAEVFIEINNHKLAASNAALEKLTWDLAGGAVSKQAATVFFQKHVRKAASSR